MNQNSTKTALALAAGLILSSPLTMAEEGSGQWTDTLKTMGKVYSDDDNPFVQEVKFFGRAHYQWNYSDGESAGNGFSGNGDELRRLRAGVSAKLLENVKVLGRMNLEKGGFRNHSIGYKSFDELYVEYSKDDLFGFDSGSIGYGRYKVAFGGEERVSSKKIKTIERSGLNNRFGSLRPTGVVVKGEKNDVTYVFGLYSTESDPETWSNWDGGNAFQAGVEFDVNEGSVAIDFIHADSSKNDGSVFDFEWATSLTHNRSYGNIDVLTNVTYGSTSDEDIYGFVIIPSTFIVPEKLEAVLRLQYGASTSEGTVPRSSSSRGLRRVARNDGVSTGAGDQNTTLYAGLNFYIDDHYAKIMTGIEYESVDGTKGRGIDGFTFWTAFRTYF